MKKLENQTIFQCSYCSKVSKRAVGIYQHERFCKKNPHNQLICASCIHCQRKEYFGREESKCEICIYHDDIYGECSSIDMSKHCDNRIKYTDFICDIDGSKMYAPNKIRRKTSFEQIKKRCNRPMIDATQECKHFKHFCDNEEK